MITDRQWTQARQITRRAVRSSLHCSIASVNADGTAHVTPIGSLLLGSLGHGIYFDVFNARLSANVDGRPEVTILAVDSGRMVWGRALLSGRFSRPPGIRLIGTVGPRRPSSPEEIARFHRAVGPLLRTRGGAAAWASLTRVRDVHVNRIEKIRMGQLTP
ncbi:pyridoxamine 5'-phosphate oxidase family protein [Gordonia sp. PDNC005]|uniref:pyridoxamine 5'-phosphate oxidase family protein n=1 Tax=unclassified Gordonia (in: high G+C Gram-positive bacteria) TaxID=2657482 RepID=UPI001963CCD1|nr:pyridoxamine 5'-phosphate oxidase family protein [Gordonia sp. PDNC005]QRY63264.1 pyridoxamine 5'-phosphate oxidase family protein [Gordonia sp. PDNC005]